MTLERHDDAPTAVESFAAASVANQFTANQGRVMRECAPSSVVPGAGRGALAEDALAFVGRSA